MHNTERIALPKVSPEDVQNCILTLRYLAENSVELAHLSSQQKVALLRAAGEISRPDKYELRKRHRDRDRLKRQKIDDHERNARALTGIRSARKDAVFVAPLQITHVAAEEASQEMTLVNPRACYVCKAEFTRLHFFYDAMCPACAELNYAKRFQTASLKGQVALITGSRLKIGYQSALMMLRAGATVIATTRFPVDSALRYEREKDFSDWKDRLHIYGLDLRHTPSVELFCRYVEQKYDRLDLLINNAAQTVRRPPGFYSHLLTNEMLKFSELSASVQALLRPFEECKTKLLPNASDSRADETMPALGWNGEMIGIGLSSSAKLSQIPYTHDTALSAETIFPQGQLDADLQQVDLREMNSWRLRLGDIPTAEMIELQLVNAIAPFVLCNKLSVMMKRDNTGQKHIVNVSAMEGKFHRFTKTDRHPHTNMAKAALNMLTHTSASDLAKYGIFMNAVDTGWVTDEDPLVLSQRKQNMHDFQPPLDIVDGAARVCDPFFHGILTGKHWCGKFLKDYFPVDW
ncbi:MAG: SDR family oxidoreductase [Candidatus Omnitrophica bacterium]|nr:SDR family oxidoreductase [Candidatus Omnitrophota bacterium]